MKALFSTHLARYSFLSFFLVAGVLQNCFSRDLQVLPLNDITINAQENTRDAWYILDAGIPDIASQVPGSDLMWLNGFEIIPGAGIIDQIGVYWGQVPDGMKARLILYNDPDNDGHPDDAVYLIEQEVDVHQFVYMIYDFPPTPISNKFFVAALFSDTTTTGSSPYPMLWDIEWYSQASWMASSSLGNFDVTDLTNNSQPVDSMSLFFPPSYQGDFIIRAHGTSMPEVSVLIIDMDGNTNSGPVMAGVLDDLSIQYNYQTYFPRNPLQDYLSVFVCLGVYNLNHQLTASEGQLLADYLNSGGRLYMEGGNTWCLDPQRVVHPMFNIDGVSYGAADMGPLNGMFGTFTDCMSFTYSGDNNSMDRIDAIPPAFQIFQNLTPSYYAGVAYDAGYYKTIGTSFEFGGLDDASYPSTKAELMIRYLEFFDVPVPLISVEPDSLRAYMVSGQNDSSLIKLNNSSATVDSYQVGIQYTDEAGVPLLPAAPQFPEQHTQPPRTILRLNLGMEKGLHPAWPHQPMLM